MMRYFADVICPLTWFREQLMLVCEVYYSPSFLVNQEKMQKKCITIR